MIIRSNDFVFQKRHFVSTDFLMIFIAFLWSGDVSSWFRDPSAVIKTVNVTNSFYRNNSANLNGNFPFMEIDFSENFISFPFVLEYYNHESLFQKMSFLNNFKWFKMVKIEHIFLEFQSFSQRFEKIKVLH